MLIVCPSCGTSYDVELASLPPSGRQVRCLRCRRVWRAELSHVDQLHAAAAAIAPGAEGAGAVETISRSANGLASADAEPEPGSPAADAGENGSMSDGAADAEVFSGGDDEAADVQGPPIVPGRLDEGRPVIEVEADPPPAPVVELAEDIETAASRRRRRSIKRQALRWPLSHVQTATLALALVSTIVVGWRSDVVRSLPQTASFYTLLGLPVNLRSLTFEDVVTSTEQHEGVPILVVEGNVVNGAHKIVEVPRLKFVVRNAARQEIYSWTAVLSRASLSPGEALAFHSRLASPPADAHDLVLRFANRRDLVATTR
jgi:predicted Zn finger-like uncharacterized protein